MSRHLYVCGKKSDYYYVLMGWDKPLQQHFLVIAKSPNEEEPFYSSLFEPNSHIPLGFYLWVLQQRGITLPEEMIAELQQDESDDMGNKDVMHKYCDGSYQRSVGFDDFEL